jgi:putative RNA 2'-phosphotransferase
MSSDNSVTNTSRFLSEILRHKPEKIGLQLDAQGWARIDDILSKAPTLKGMALTRTLIDRAVAENDKKRFLISEDGAMIRALQGHSVEVDLQLARAVPPTRLFHGTVENNLPSILKQGLVPMNRHHVHLSADLDTAQRVASRRQGKKTVLLAVDCKAMLASGCQFYLSENRVWLVDHVAPKFLTCIEPDHEPQP